MVARVGAMDGGPNNFEAWCRRRGCCMEKIKITKTSALGFGIETKSAVEADEVALSIPVDLLLTVAAAARSQVGKSLLKSQTTQGQRVSTQALLYVVMINGLHDPSSPWHEYLRLIPEVHGDPLWWTPESCQEWLQGTQLLHEVQRHLDQLSAVYDSLFPALSEELPLVFPEKHFTFQGFLWARSCLASRAFTEEHLNSFLSGEKNLQKNNWQLTADESARLLPDFSGMLCPLLDTANHDPAVQVKVGLCKSSSDGQLHLGMSQNRRVDAGQEYFINYGNHRSNLELLLGHGFCEPQNPKDTFPLKLGSNSRITASKVIQDALKMSALDMDEIHVLSLRKLFPERLLAILRLIYLPYEDLERLCLEGKDALLGILMHPIAFELCPNTEMQVMFTLKSELLRKQKQIPESSPEGSLPSAPSYEDWCEYYANLYRAGQHEILTAALLEADARLLDLSVRRKLASEASEEGEEEEDDADDEILEDKELHPAKKQCTWPWITLSNQIQSDLLRRICPLEIQIMNMMILEATCSDFFHLFPFLDYYDPYIFQVSVR